jgi:protein SCO1/2
MIATPDGRISRYLYGVDYAPRDLRLALVEASERKIGSPVDELLLFCYHYDPATGKYGAIAVNFLRMASAATVLGIAIFLTILLRQEGRHRTS